jgi:hypothetical protein
MVTSGPEKAWIADDQAFLHIRTVDASLVGRTRRRLRVRSAEQRSNPITQTVKPDDVYETRWSGTCAVEHDCERPGLVVVTSE